LPGDNAVGRQEKNIAEHGQGCHCQEETGRNIMVLEDKLFEILLVHERMSLVGILCVRAVLFSSAIQKKAIYNKQPCHLKAMFGQGFE